MKIKLSSKIIQSYPGLNYVVILIKNINNLRKVSSLSQLLRGAAVVAKNDLKKTDRKDLFNRVTEQFVDDGETFLESYHLAAKVKKILSNKDLDGKNNLLNLVNLLSLKYFLPLHGFDLDQAEQDYLISFYQTKKGKKAPELDFLPETKHIAIWFPNLAGYQDEELDHLIGELNANFARYLNVQINEVYHLDADHREVDLGYVSQKELDYQAQQKEIQPVEDQTSPIHSEDSAVSILSATKTHSTLPSAKEQILQLFTKSAEISFSSHLSEQEKSLSQLIEIEVPADAAHGDYSTNLAMKLTKIVGQAPQSIAQTLLSNLPANDLIAKSEVVGPGFINLHLKQEYFAQQLASILELKEQYGLQDLGQNKQVMVEFGSLNMAKPFGAQHFLTTIIGQTLANLYRVTGHQVITADFPGDWGTQFGKTLYAYKHWGEKEVVEQDSMNELRKLYVRFHEEAEKDPTLDDAARAEFKKLEEGDLENTALWQWIIDISQKDLDTVYKTMGVHFDCRYPESKYNQTNQTLLEQGKQAGIFVEGENGAYVVNFEQEKLPVAIIQKSDGTSIYMTRDLASIQDRLQQYPELSKLIYVVDSAQTLHFEQLFATAKQFHQVNPDFPLTEFKHVAYGRMSFAGSSMSTRKGNFILARDIIKEALDRSMAIVKEKSASLSPNEQKQVASGLALGAIKYAMICQSPESDIIFDWDKVLSFEGNSAPYLQYTQARANSILRKAQEASQTPESPAADQVSLFSINEVKQEQNDISAEEQQTIFGSTHEQALLKLLNQFPDRILAATQNYKPNLLTNYLFQLAQAFNSFYSAIPVMKTHRPDLLKSRLDLVSATSQVLQNGLNILGLTTFERM